MQSVRSLTFSYCWILAIILHFTGVLGFAQTKKPNIIILMTDDVGWMDLGAYGGGADRGAPTPNLDKFAAEGMRFTEYYAQPTCTLGRLAVMIGRQPVRAGVLNVFVPGDPNGIYKDEVTLPQYLKKAGYHTMQTGKWHLGDKPKFYPTQHGFDEMHFMLPYYGNVYTYDDPNFYPDFPFDNAEFMARWKTLNLKMWEQNPGDKEATAMLNGREFGTNDLKVVDQWQTDYVIYWIKQHAKDTEPFFLDVNFMRMHNPSVVPDEDLRKSPGKYPYTDGLVILDRQTGQVMQALKDAGIDDNTIVIWTTDNGAWIDTWPDSGNTPFRGEKSTTFEGGFRVPAMVRWPGHVPAGAVSHYMFSCMDWFPTLSVIAGLPAPPRHWADNSGHPIVFDGIDQSDLILGKGAGKRDNIFYFAASGGVAVRVGRFKLTYNSHDSWLGVNRNQTAASLYDLVIDPYEQHDIVFMGSAPMNDAMKTSPGRSPLHDHGWIMSSLGQALHEEFAEMQKYPNRFLGLYGEVYWESLPELPKDLSEAPKEVPGMPQD
jgi:arylsulfatase A-like enzyme